MSGPGKHQPIRKLVMRRMVARVFAARAQPITRSPALATELGACGPKRVHPAAGTPPWGRLAGDGGVGVGIMVRLGGPWLRPQVRAQRSARDSGRGFDLKGAGGRDSVKPTLLPTRSPLVDRAGRYAKLFSQFWPRASRMDCLRYGVRVLIHDAPKFGTVSPDCQGDSIADFALTSGTVSSKLLITGPPIGGGQAEGRRWQSAATTAST